jgi:hypothetical protein
VSLLYARACISVLGEFIGYWMLAVCGSLLVLLFDLIAFDLLSVCFKTLEVLLSVDNGMCRVGCQRLCAEVTNPFNTGVCCVPCGASATACADAMAAVASFQPNRHQVNNGPVRPSCSSR